MNYAVAGLRPADKQCFDSATRRKTQTSESSHTETFSLSEYKNRGTRPRFLRFCKAKPISSSHAAGMTVAHNPCALFPPNLAFGKEGGQACRSRPRKIPHKSQGVYLTFIPLLAPRRRDLVRRADERGISGKVSLGTFPVSKGDSVPLRGLSTESLLSADAADLRRTHSARSALRYCRRP